MESADIVVIGSGVWRGTKIESESKDASGAFRVITFQRPEDGTWNPTGSLMPLKSLMIAGTYLCNKHTSAALTQNLSKADSCSPFASRVVRNI